MKKILAFAALAAAACIGLTACSASGKGSDYYPDNGNWSGNLSVGGSGEADVPDGMAPGGVGDNDAAPPAAPDSSNGGYVHEDIIEQDFTGVATASSSYFSLDRNTAGYSLMRSQIQRGYKISPYSVRIEEMINYFDYNFESAGDDTLKVSTYLSDCPWNENSKLMLAGVKTTEYNLEDVNANYVFLIDVSGSMSGDSRLGLAKKGFNYLLDGLGENDVVSIVTYASGVKTVLDGGECTKSGKTNIRNAISKLKASGATSGGDGLERAYNIAQKHFITGGNNRVIIISDGDFNVGMSSTDELKEFIQTKAESGVYLSVLGVGMGNMRDDLLETLATCGNGNYAYLDNETEARKVFVDELNGTLKTVATDAKACVTFTSSVEKYRLIGYDTKIISKDEFDNIDADTGEIGSNLCVAALYEITLKEDAETKLADVTVRCKTDNSGNEDTAREYKAEVTLETYSSEDLSFISCVAEFGLILRDSKYKGTSSISNVLERLDSLTEYISGDVYKQEFVTLVGKASESGHYN